MLSTGSCLHGESAVFCLRQPSHSSSLASGTTRLKLQQLLYRPRIEFFSSPPLRSPSSAPIPRSVFQGRHPVRNLDLRSDGHLRCGVSSNAASSGSSGGRSFRDYIEVFSEVTSTAFPVWVALGCLLGLVNPASFNWVKPNWIVLGITVTMLGMGMTLSLDDLRGAFSMPKELLAGFFLQYSVSSGFFNGLVPLLIDINVVSVNN